MTQTWKLGGGTSLLRFLGETILVLCGSDRLFRPMWGGPELHMISLVSRVNENFFLLTSHNCQCLVSLTGNLQDAPDKSRAVRGLLDMWPLFQKLSLI